MFILVDESCYSELQTYLKRVTKNGCQEELEAVEYKHLVGAWEWRKFFSEIVRHFGVTESRVRDITDRYYKQQLAPYRQGDLEKPLEGTICQT